VRFNAATSDDDTLHEASRTFAPLHAATHHDSREHISRCRGWDSYERIITLDVPVEKFYLPFPNPFLSGQDPHVRNKTYMQRDVKWENVQSIITRSYTCGYCNTPLASEKGWEAIRSYSTGIQPHGFVYICHLCLCPTFFDLDMGKQTPGVPVGNTVHDIPEQSVNDLYNEARNTMTVGSYTAAVLCCRKLLMHIAVSKGAPENQNFQTYVQYLADNHYIPPDAKGWVDHIRQKGNEANHDIVIMQKDDAEELILFIEMLLKVIFEFPAAIQKKLKPAPPVS
jgi:uncharacterized protein DUF4145